MRPREFWSATAIYALLTAALTYPLSLRAASVVVSDVPDIHLYIWTLAWTAHAITTQPLSLFDASIFYPLSNTLAYSENLIGSGLIAAPIIWTTGNYVLALNLVTVLSVVLCGSGGYLLGRRLGLSVQSAFVCGLIFAFSPARFVRIGQTHLATVQWVPFALAYLHSYFEHGREKDLRIFGVFVSLQAITSGHGMLFLLIAAFVLMVHRMVTRPRLSPVQVLKDLGITGALALAPLALIAIPYQLVQREMGFRRFLENWTVNTASYLASPSDAHQAILTFFAPKAGISESAQAFLFPGYLPLLFSLAAGAFAIRGRLSPSMRRSTIAYGLIACLAVLLISRPPFSVWPLVYWLPGFSLVRVPSRFVILLVLALSVLSAIGYDRLQRAWASRYQWSAVVVVTLLLIVEFSFAPIPVVPFAVRPPAADRWLAYQARPFVVAEFPNSGGPRDQTTYMLHAIAHWQRTIHGYSGFEPPQHTALYRTLRNFPDRESLNELRAYEVTYAVVHIDRYSPADWAEVEARLSDFKELELVFQDPLSRVYRVRSNTDR